MATKTEIQQAVDYQKKQLELEAYQAATNQMAEDLKKAEEFDKAVAELRRIEGLVQELYKQREAGMNLIKASINTIKDSII